jgi:hypothetical protein
VCSAGAVEKRSFLAKFVGRKLCSAGTTTAGICRPVHRDSAQPCQQVLLRLQPVQVAIESEEDILCHFLRRTAIAENAVRNAVDAGLVLFHQVTKSISRL